jgi:nucleotide-binding universal stress UspA family protein
MGNLVSTLIKQAQGGDFLFIILKRSTLQKGVSCLLDQHEIDKIIGHSYCPILSINENPTPKEIKNILVPIDISEGTTKRLLWASMFAKITGAKIRIISALKINIDESKSLAFKNAEKIKSMLMERGIECEVELIKVQGQFMHEVVLAYIETRKPDFIIIRKHHIASYFSTTIGDFAKEIIRGSGIPVFTVSQSQKDIESILPFDFF